MSTLLCAFWENLSSDAVIYARYRYEVNSQKYVARGANCAFTKGRAAVGAFKAFSAVNDVRHNPIYNLNCNPPNPIIKSHFHACRVCPAEGTSPVSMAETFRRCKPR